MIIRTRILAAALGLALLVPTAAFAKRAPTTSERTAIRGAVNAFVHRAGSPAAPDNRVVRIRVSTVDARYASAFLASASAGPSEALLRKRNGAWKVIDFGSGEFPCSDLPRSVYADLVGSDC